MGIDPRNTRAMWEESLTMIPKIWEDGLFEWQGQFWNVPPREVRPKPYQKPHPPIWVAARRPCSPREGPGSYPQVPPLVLYYINTRSGCGRPRRWGRPSTTSG
jgi:hypothetical protein